MKEYLKTKTNTYAEKCKREIVLYNTGFRCMKKVDFWTFLNHIDIIKIIIRI